MQHFSQISIIYNPNSTGSGKSLASKLKKELQQRQYEPKISLVQTQHAGHAEEVAYKIAKESQSPLIISASGDGGYNEVVNGALKAQAEGATPVTGLLPAGNANDHYHNVHGKDIAADIIKHRLQTIDVLELKGTVNGQPFTRYAHSYIGFGLTPEIGAKLNETDLNWFREIGVVGKGLFDFKPVRIQIGRSVRTYDSIVMSNVGKMSKYLTLAKTASVTDGKFELTTFRKRSKYWLLRNLVTASTTGLSNPRELRSYSFTTRHSLAVQLDGEIYKLDKNTTVRVRISDQKLRCVV